MKYFLYYLCLPVLFYPVYFLAANLIDSLFGDQQLINWLYFESRSILIKIYFKDWLSSLPLMFMMFYLLILPIDVLSGKIAGASKLSVYIVCIAIVTAGAYFAGFREFGLLINALAVFFIISFYYLTNALIFAQVKK